MPNPTKKQIDKAIKAAYDAFRYADALEVDMMVGGTSEAATKAAGHAREHASECHRYLLNMRTKLGYFV